MIEVAFEQAAEWGVLVWLVVRHYSATELIAGGVDLRTVADRLGDATAAMKVCAAGAGRGGRRRRRDHGKADAIT